MIDIQANLSAVEQRIRSAEQAWSREPGSVQLIAVSKRHPGAAIERAWRAGQRSFGESYVQEARDKMATLAHLNIDWHFIGPVQSNKTRSIAEAFGWVHSLADLKHARRLNNQRPPEMPPLNVCIQVNLSGEASKSGIPCSGLAGFAADVAQLDRLTLRGLMTLPAPATGFDEQRAPFARLSQLFGQLQEAGHTIDTLSMGMSADLEAAIAEGATMVRVGTAIFGPRIA